MQKLTFFLKEKYPFCGILSIPPRSSFPQDRLVLPEKAGKPQKYRNIHEQKIVWKIKGFYYNVSVGIKTAY